MNSQEIEYVRIHGCNSPDYCKTQVKLIENEIQILKAEFTECNRLISEKVKGQVRSSQRRRHEIKEQIETLHRRRCRWFNGGVD
jgi:hypothetical protein